MAKMVTVKIAAQAQPEHFDLVLPSELFDTPLWTINLPGNCKAEVFEEKVVSRMMFPFSPGGGAPAEETMYRCILLDATGEQCTGNSVYKLREVRDLLKSWATRLLDPEKRLGLLARY